MNATLDRPGDHQVFCWTEGLRIGLVAVAGLAAWTTDQPPTARVATVWIVAVIIGGWPVLKEAVENLAAGRMTMELSMSIAIVAAAAIGEFSTALVITLFVLAAEVLEQMTAARGRRAIGDLLARLPRIVKVRRSAGVRETPTDELRLGESVLVDPGALVPVDGLVLHGHSFIDQSRITGELQPVEKVPGSPVYAGTVNQSGALEIRVDRVGRDTSYGRIIEAVEQSEQATAPVQRIADRLAGYLVYTALGAAALTFLATRDLRSTIAVVIVAGACGIAAGTPLALLGGIGRAARLGAIVKGGRSLETLGRLNTVVFDKTGTLTLGHTSVQSVSPIAGVAASSVLSAAACAELRSEHPLGKAIVSHVKALGSEIGEPAQFTYTPGRGVAAVLEGQLILVGNRALMVANHVVIPPELAATPAMSSDVLVAREGEFLGAIAVGDQVRSEAATAVRSLRDMKIRTVLLTGDNATVAQTVARQVGIAQVEAGLLPESKVARIKQWVGGGQVVAMVGDGINDAPALTAASIGVAMGSGTDVARESADVVLLGNDLEKLVETVRLARWTRQIIWQNFAGTIAVDLIGITLAAAGLLAPAAAAFIHVASEMTFILNAARLLPRAGRPSASASAAAAEHEAA